MKQFSNPHTASLDEAIAFVTANIQEGVECPCCAQLAKRYKRKLNSSMAYALILIYRSFRTSSDWLHVPEYLAAVCKTGPTIRGGDWAKLVHWGLITGKDDAIRKDGSRRVGFYKITDLGRAFVEGRERVPKHVFLYAQRLVGVDKTTVSISEALSEKFNYGELMAS